MKGLGENLNKRQFPNFRIIVIVFIEKYFDNKLKDEIRRNY